MSRGIIGVLGLLALIGSGCGEDPRTQSAPNPYANAYPTSEGIKFLDDVQSNTSLDAGIRDLTLLGVDGKEIRIDTLKGNKNLIVVVTRGNTDPICPYCSTQVAEYIKNYPAIAAHQTEVIVVYPIEKLADQQRRDAFLANARKLLGDQNRPIPFPVLLDVELKAVDRLGIRKNLSKPATYLLDESGRVRFAYVGSSLPDRPSIKAMLEQLAKLKTATPPAKGSGKAN